MDIIEEVKAQERYMISLRRRLHQCPEPGMKEFETSGIIKDELDKLSINYLDTAGTGIIAVLGKEDAEHTIALRADMDALSIDEKNDFTYVSHNSGFMHACGHDGHMASLLGAVRVLKDHEQELNTRIKILFQPSEENCKGAQAIIDEGNIDDVEAIFGAHIFTDIPAGKVSVEPGYRMADSMNFKIIFEGRSGHAGKPHQCADALLAAAAFVINVQSIISRKIDPIESGVISLGKMTAGTAHNAVAGEAVIEGTARFFKKEVGTKIKNELINVLKGTASVYGCEEKIEFKAARHPSVINDEDMTLNYDSFIKANYEEVFNKLIHVPPMLLGEDFSNYQKRIPGIFAFIGGGNKEGNCVYPNHHEKFNFDKSALVNAAELYVLFALYENE